MPVNLQQPISVTGGLIQGLPAPEDPNVTSFLGVPYAAPPLGPNRFKPPQPVVPWDGVRTCDKLSDVNIQDPPPWRYFDTLKGHPQSEDVLYLNVWVPGETDKHEPGPYPVLMWMHGGGYREGGNADKNFNGTGLAQKGVIVVVPNFRLGLTGFLSHPELSKESPHNTSGNQGLLDCLQVLYWIRDNISNFGGDPNRVTLSGQSSGSAMTHIFLLSPVTKGLIHRAIMQSGVKYTRDPNAMSTHPSYRLLKDAEEDGIAVLEDVGVKNINELRLVDDRKKFAEVALKRDTRYWGPPPSLRPVLDGYLLTQPYTKTLDEGPPNDIPIMTGMNLDEGGIYNEPRFDVTDLHESVQGRFGDYQAATKFFDAYPLTDKEVGKGPLNSWNTACRDYMRVDTVWWGQQYNQHCKSPVFAYMFTHAPPQWKGFSADFNRPKTKGYELQKGPLVGAYHSTEIAFGFNSVVTSDMRPWTDRDRQVGDEVSTLWANFIKYGTPNGRGEKDRPKGVPEWLPVKDQPNAVMEIGGKYGPMPLGSEEGVKFWKDFFEEADQTA